MEFKIFSNYPELKYGFSEKTDGPMKVAINDENRNLFFDKLGLNDKNVIAPVQSHSTIALIVDATSNIKLNADALITKDSNAILSITSADCFPVYFFDPKNNIIGLAHCGWRGVISELCKETVSKMGISLKDLLVGIGPGIQKCHFEVQNIVAENFKNYPGSIIETDDEFYIDLPKVIITQLGALGIPLENIETSLDCTFCESGKYYSYRRDKPEAVRPQIAYIGIAKK
jgi:YfiH family protein